MSNSTLIVADVDQIQGYVFGAGQLRAVRGSSALIDALGMALGELVNKAKGECLQHQGGQLVAYVDKEKCDFLINAIHKMAREIGGPALTLAVGSSELLPFVNAIKEAFSQVKKQKDHNATHEGTQAYLPSGGHVRHCELCRQFPSIYDDDADKPNFHFGDNDDHYLCESCYQRVKVKIEDIPFEKEIRERLRRRGMPVSRPCYKIEELWPSMDERRYMAMVSADGNGIGSLLEQIEDKNVYQRFSTALIELGKNAIVEALTERRFKNLLPRYPNDTFRLMPIISGGDDFTVLMPAEFAFDFALSWAMQFKKLSQQDAAVQAAMDSFFAKDPERFRLYFSGEPPQPLTLAIGIAVAKPNFPIFAFNRIARQLRSSAKKAKSINPNERVIPGIDFTVITTPNTEDLIEMRKPYSFAQGVKLTAKPYSLDDFEKLLILRNAFLKANVPQSKCKWLYTEFWQGAAQGAEALKFVMARHDTIEELKFVKARHDPSEPSISTALKNLGCKMDSHHFMPFIEDNKSNKWHQTPLLDALEIVAFNPDK